VRPQPRLVPSDSVASEPSAWPTWAPNIAPPICFIIPSSGVMASRISSGSCEGIALPMASTTRAATGSTSCFHTSIVFSTHSARLHASEATAPAGITVSGSSHSSARRIASSTSARSPAPIEWSGPAAATVLRAVSFARSQFTGPPL